MITKPAWPTGADVLGLIDGLEDVTAPDEAECSIEVGAVVNDFEDMTGCMPFLAAVDPSVRVFDPPSAETLFLNGCAVSIAAITAFVQQGSQGTLLVLGQDFVTLPENAALRDRPITRIRLHCSLGGYPQSIQVLARWGFGDAIPIDLWNAVRKKAAANAIRQTMNISGPAKHLELGTQVREFGLPGATTALQEWERDYMQALSKYDVRPVI